MDTETPSAILHTRYLDPNVKRSLTWGLQARWDELVRDRTAGYGDDATKGQREALIHDTRSAYASGLLTYLPPFARFTDTPVERKAKRHERTCNCP